MLLSKATDSLCSGGGWALATNVVVGSVKGTLVLIVFAFLFCFSFFKHGLLQNLQFQGWGWFSNFRGFRWLWVLCLSNRLKGECF